MFYVKVPVLSEQMADVEPNVSTDYKFFTRTYLYDILSAAKAMQTVTVIKSPSGTLATMIPIMNAILTVIGYPYIKLIIKKVNPAETAITETNFIK